MGWKIIEKSFPNEERVVIEEYVQANNKLQKIMLEVNNDSLFTDDQLEFIYPLITSYLYHCNKRMPETEVLISRCTIATYLNSCR